MANYTTIRVAVTGLAEDIVAFKTKHVRRNSNGGRFIDFQTLIPTTEPCPDTWGSFSIGYDFEIHSEAPGQIEFTFDVKGGDAAPILREVARLYPSLSGVIAAEEEGGSYAAQGSMRGGELSYDRVPWSEAIWELVYGKAY